MGARATFVLDELNPAQREAVLASKGPVLVLAGAGSGKTRVITYRIAHLIAQGVPAESILAVTFTNKAAEEMRQRVAQLAARAGLIAADPTISTFHSFCARLLRREAPRLGLRRDFFIYDDDDQMAAIKMAQQALGLQEKRFPPRATLERISQAKNQGRSAEQLAAQARDDWEEGVWAAYQAYERILAQAGALDFDDLLLRGVEVLDRFPDAREQWQRRFRYLHVDEYQDTNPVQYQLLRLLSGQASNVCVVGDEDQAIYSWRGADMGILLRFAQDFPNALVVRLEQNYRSTQAILDAAGGVVAKNVRRLGKTLSATRGGGQPLRYFEARDAVGEAEFVAGEIRRLQREEPGKRVAVAYRTHAQSRAFEEALRKLGVRYRVVGGFSFYRRAEVMDVLACARLAVNADDDVALLRVINTPPRGIGPATLETLRELAARRGSSLWSALVELTEGGAPGRALQPLRGFRQLIEALAEERDTSSPPEFLRLILERTGYLDVLEHARSPEERARVENLRELVNAAAELAERGESLADLIAQAALVSDADDYDEHAPVTLITLHSTKGLEFDHVFLCGLEEGLFPHIRAGQDDAAMEEERRLCYVGMTRARDTLTLTRAAYRRSHGDQRPRASLPSRFLSEIPRELIETVPGSLAHPGETRRYEYDEDFPPARRYPEDYSGSDLRSSRRARSPGKRPTEGAHPLIGKQVRHPSYGIGTIIAVEGEAGDRKITVSFLDYGVKKLLERYAQLERA